MTVPPIMQAVEVSQPGRPDVLRVTERPTPRPAPGEMLIRVEAAGLNNGDLMQRRGFYNPPPGITDIPGLEVAGTVAALGEGVTGWAPGDRVCALLAGGGYAEYAVAPEGQCLPIPDGMDMVQAAGLPETLFTCWTTLIDDGGLQAGDLFLVHGGSSGIGTMAIPLAHALGATVVTTAGSDAKCEACRKLGADLAINYRTDDFVAVITDRFGENSVNVVLDMVGGDYVGRDIQIMARKGRHVSIGLLSGTADATISMANVLMKQLVITGSTLRSRSPEEKRSIRDRLVSAIWPRVEDGRIAPVIHASFPMTSAPDAHRALEAGGHIGKIILTTR